jgi:hypothetical protein
MTYKQHWKRGAFILLATGFAGLSAAIAGGMLAAIVLLAIELVWHRPDWGDQEGPYLWWGAALGVLAWMPLFVSQMLEGKLMPGWPSVS